jgi:phosphatidylserine/phosphatidylglycerophosphate/cardiolipin synthase-like enzyme
LRQPISTADRDRRRTLALFLLVGLVGCGRISKDDDPRHRSETDGSDDDSDPTRHCLADHVLEIVPLDIWGRDLVTATLSVDADTLDADADLGPHIIYLPIDDSDAIVNITLSAPDHNGSTVQVRHDGDAAYRVTGNTGEAMTTSSVEIRTIEGEECTVASVYIGLDHTWFAATGRPPDNSIATFMFSPEDFWATVQKDIVRATSTLTWSTWWWESDMEFTRPIGHASMATYERRTNTSMSLFNGLSGVDRRLLINRFWDDNLDWLNNVTADADLLNRATHVDDLFEVMLQGNATEVPVTGTYDAEPAPIDFGSRVRTNPRYADRDIAEDVIAMPIDIELQVASWHQKGIVIDSEVAFIGGMNTRGLDWDTDAHLVFDWRRMAFDATDEEREAVVNRTALPDNVPRRDYGIRVEGPAAWEAETVFQTRWQAGRASADAYAEYTTDLTLPARPDPISGGVPTQVVATMPKPWSEMSIWETHGKAFSNATEYIFIEDQYLRAPILEDEIIARMNTQPDLVLIVVSMPVAWWDGGSKWSYYADSTFRALFPDRYALFQMKTVDLVIDDGWVWDEVAFYSMDIQVHSKLRIVDDRYLSVGSCNMNNRGYKYEGELNVNVLDGGLSSLVRSQVFDNLVGEYWAPYLSDDPVNNLSVFRMAAEDNQALHDWWTENAADLSADEADEYWPEYRPSGFLYPLEFTDDWELDVGPDLF